jgi:hypothetical protein
MPFGFLASAFPIDRDVLVLILAGVGAVVLIGFIFACMRERNRLKNTDDPESIERSNARWGKSILILVLFLLVAAALIFGMDFISGKLRDVQRTIGKMLA